MKKIAFFLSLFIFIFLFLQVGHSEDLCSVDGSACEVDLNSVEVLGGSGSIEQQTVLETNLDSIDVNMYVFFSPGCPHCAKLEEYIETIKKSHPTLKIKSLDIGKNIILFKNLLGKYKVPTALWGKVPTVFISDYSCVGSDVCIDTIEEKIIECEAQQGCVSPEIIPINNNGSGQDIDSDSKFTFIGIAGLAIIDAINPCALAVLVLLLTSILIKFPKQKMKVLMSGLAFSFAVFLSYLTIGILIVLGFKSLQGLSVLSTSWVYQLLGVLAVILGIINVKDYFKGESEGFLMSVPVAWRPKMQSLVRSTISPKGAFVVGVLVSLFLLPCTAGPYFVAGGILAGVDWIGALPWLLIYNAIFILPMVIITFLVFGGFAAVEDIAGWRSENVSKIHLVAGLVLLLLGVAMVLRII